MKSFNEIIGLVQPMALFCQLDYGVLSIEGSDANTFLQGQITNDINQIDLQMSQLAAVCTPKGRVIALGRLLRQETGFWWLLPKSMVARLQDHLKRYLLRAKVVLTNKSDELMTLGVGGTEGIALVQQRFQCDLTAPLSTMQTEVGCVTRMWGDYPRIEITGPIDKITALMEEFALSKAAIWQANEMIAGVPTIYPDTSEMFIPQSINLDLIQAVNFKKGCYTGQEIVARTQHLGRIKRRLYLGTVTSEEAPRIGDKLSSPAAAANEETGTLVEVVSLGESSDYLVLFSAAKNLVATPLGLASSSAAITRLPFPYDVD